MARKVKDTVAVVTGASSGIGRATALEIARRGGYVVAAARRRSALEELASDAASLKGRITAVPTDVADEREVHGLAQRALDEHGRVDAWVNNAAVTAFGRVEEIPLEDFRRVCEVNVIGYIHGIRAVLPYMREQGSGVIVNVSSVVGRVGQPYATAYTMTKHAIRALSIGLRQELLLDKIKGIDVCTVMPGSTDTPLFSQGANYTGWFAKPMSPISPPEKVAQVIISCIRSPRPEVFVGGAARMMNLQSHLAPRRSERSLAKRVDRDHFDKRRHSERTAGNLYDPDEQRAEVTGGWDGRKALNVRRVAVGVGAAAGLWMMMRSD